MHEYHYHLFFQFEIPHWVHLFWVPRVIHVSPKMRGMAVRRRSRTSRTTHRNRHPRSFLGKTDRRHCRTSTNTRQNRLRVVAREARRPRDDLCEDVPDVLRWDAAGGQLDGAVLLFAVVVLEAVWSPQPTAAVAPPMAFLPVGKRAPEVGAARLFAFAPFEQSLGRCGRRSLGAFERTLRERRYRGGRIVILTNGLST